MATISKDQIQIATVASNSIKLDQIGDLAKTTEGQGELAKDLAADNSDATLGSKTPLVVINGYYVTKYLQYFNLDMNGKSISNVSQLASINFMYTFTLRATYLDFTDVANSGATDLIIKSGSTDFMSFSVSNSINVYQPF